MRKFALILVALAAVLAFAPRAAQADPSFPKVKAQIKAEKVALRECVKKQIRQAAKGGPYQNCIGWYADECQSGSEVSLPANQGGCLGHYVINAPAYKKALYCVGMVWLKWTGKRMQRTHRAPFTCTEVGDPGDASSASTARAVPPSVRLAADLREVQWSIDEPFVGPFALKSKPKPGLPSGCNTLIAGKRWRCPVRLWLYADGVRTGQCRARVIVNRAPLFEAEQKLRRRSCGAVIPL